MSKLEMQKVLVKAIDLATKLHEGQVDKSNKPYILHPMRVMESVSDVECKILAVLHDVLEDCDIDEEGLIQAGIPEYLVKKLEFLTKKKGEKYFDYILRAKSDELTRQVKLADLKDNMDLSRLYPEIDKSKLYDTTYLRGYLKERDFKRYQKYQIATEMLQK